MDALAIRWWTDGGFVAQAAPSAPWIVGVRGQPDRDTARRTIRTALVAALVEWSGVDAAYIQLGGDAGEAPYALLERGGVPHRIALAISHDGDVSVAAFQPGGAVGIDVMAVTEAPDWAAVARDYLGPACADALAALPAPARAPAFARAWSEREARLKCLGRPLAEWSAEETALLSGCACRPLDVPDGYVGTLACVPAA
jgi:4'-phosphopantetheinyl transferase